MPTLNRASQFFAVYAEAPIAIRVVIFFLVWLGVWLPIAIPLALVFKWRPFQPLEVQQKLPFVISLYLVAPLVLWGAAWVQNSSFSDYGLVWNLNLLRSFGWGFALGTIGLIILFAVQMRLGWVDLQPQSWRCVTALPSILLLSLLIAGIEELIFRGFFFDQLLLEYDFWTAAIASSLIFALLHLVWEGQKNVPQLPGLSLMGVVLCFAIAADSGSIGLAWGLHAGWVWTMASLDSTQIVKFRTQAPEWLAGADGKPLAGATGLLFLLITGLLLLPIEKVL